MSDNCLHENFNVEALPTRYVEENVTVLLLRVQCSDCKTIFRFRNMSINPTPDQPSMSADGVRCMIPMIADTAITCH